MMASDTFKGFVPQSQVFFAAFDVHAWSEGGVGLPGGLDVAEVGKDSCAESSEECCTEGGGVEHGGSDDASVEEIALHLHEEVVGAGAAVDLEFGEWFLEVVFHGGQDVDVLEGDAFEGGVGDVTAGGASGHAPDDAAGVGVPVGCA